LDVDVADLTNTAVRKDTEASVSSIKLKHNFITDDAILMKGSIDHDQLDGFAVNVLTLQGDLNGAQIASE
jgi:hypothetical protein